MQPKVIIQSRRNGKFYPIGEDGELKENEPMSMTPLDLFPYDIVDKCERYWTYHLRENSTFLQKLKRIKKALTH